jgi:hypothetical protein
MSKRIALTALATACTIAAGCGDRNAGWDTTPEVHHVVALSGSFAVVDESVHVVSFFGVDSGTALTTRRAGTGYSVAEAKASPGGDRLYVLAQGVRPRLKPEDDAPAVWVYDGTGGGGLLKKYGLDAPLNGLTVDPEGQFVVVHPSGDADAFLENPNELVIIDVGKDAGPGNPVVRTLRSYGGTPKRLTFTKKLALPGGERRLLVVETESEVSLLDLYNLDRPEVTVLLNSADGKTSVSPSALLVDDGDPARTDDTRVAIRTNEAGLFLLTLVPVPEGKVVPNDFEIVVNIIGLNTTPSDFAFVETDKGRRIAVLEPSQNRASLVDPDTTVVTPVPLPTGYGSMAVVTNRTGTDSTGSDVALLWGGYSAAIGVAFWSLGKSVDEPYRSIEVLPGVASTVGEVVDVPAPNDSMKVLVPSYLQTGYGGGTGAFYMLDLGHRTATPLFTSASRLSMTLSRDGQRAWFFQEGTTKLAKVDLNTLHPVNLYLDQAANEVFDVKSQKGANGSAVIALHQVGNYAATVFDAVSPNDANAARYVGLLQGGF